jgi:hypothetical protein
MFKLAAILLCLLFAQHVIAFESCAFITDPNPPISRLNRRLVPDLIKAMNEIRAEAGEPPLNETQRYKIAQMNVGSLKSWFLHELTLAKPHFSETDIFIALGELKTAEALVPLFEKLKENTKTGAVSKALVEALTKIGSNPELKTRALGLLNSLGIVNSTLPIREWIKMQQLRGSFGDTSIVPELIEIAQGKLQPKDIPKDPDQKLKIEADAIFALARIGEQSGLNVVARLAPRHEYITLMEDFSQRYFLVTTWEALAIAAYEKGHRGSMDRVIEILDSSISRGDNHIDDFAPMYLSPNHARDTTGFLNHVLVRFEQGSLPVLRVLRYFPRQRDKILRSAVEDENYPNREEALRVLLERDRNGSIEIDAVNYAFYIAQTTLSVRLKIIALNALATETQFGPNFARSPRFAIDLMGLWHTEKDANARKYIDLFIEQAEIFLRGNEYVDFRAELIMELADGRLTFEQLGNKDENLTLKSILANPSRDNTFNIRDFPSFSLKNEVKKANEILLANFRQYLGLPSLSEKQVRALLAAYRVGFAQAGQMPFTLAGMDNLTDVQKEQKSRILEAAGLHPARILARADLATPTGNPFFYYGLRFSPLPPR